MTAAADTAQRLRDCIVELADRLLGKPSSRTRLELRYRTHGSLAVYLTTGRWRDYEQGAGGDALDLVQRQLGLGTRAALDWARDYLGDAAVTTPAVRRSAPTRASNDDDAEARRRAARTRWAEARPATGTVVESYLRHTRNIPAGLVPATVRFHPELWHSSAHGTLPAMLAAATRDGTIRAIQATFLDLGDLTDNPTKTKAAPARKSYGTVRGAAVRFGRLVDKLTLTEGVEDALVLHAVTGATVWAVLGKGNFKSVQVPPAVQQVTLGIDNDDDGRDAAAEAAARFISEGRTVLVAEPPSGKDFNSVLEGLSHVG